MFLSIVKTILLTCSTFISFPRSKVVSSFNDRATFDTGDILLNNEITINDDDSIKVYSDDIINNSDLRSDLSSIGGGGITIDVSISYQTDLGVINTFNCQFGYFDSTYIQFRIDSDNYLRIDLSGSNGIFTGGNNNHSCVYATFGYYDSSATYERFYNVLYNYLPYLEITIPQYNVNNQKFTYLANSLRLLGDIDEYLSLSYNGVSYSYMFNVNNAIFNGNTDDIVLTFEPSNYGLFLLYEGINHRFGLFIDDFVFKTKKSNIYNNLNIALNLDLSITSSLFVEDFKFKNDFNYNAIYNFAYDSVFCRDADFNGTTPSYKEYVIDLPYFVSNGYIFNQVVVRYEDAYAQRYIDKNGKVHWPTVVNPSNTGYCYFAGLKFKDSNSDYSVMVCSRKYSSYTDSNDDVQWYMDFGVIWLNNAYQNLTFINNLSSSQKDHLARFNDYMYSNGFNPSTTYIGYSFDLINNGFNGLVGLLNTQILPGINLGLLVLTPFVIALLLFIARLFKR